MTNKQLKKMGQAIADRYITDKGYSVIAKDEWGVDVVAKDKDGVVLIFVQADVPVSTDASRWLLETGFSGIYRKDKLVIRKQKRSYKVDYYEYVDDEERSKDEQK